MAVRTAIGSNSTGLTQIMNVSAKVGTETGCANLSNDVEAIQRLFNIFLPTTAVFKAGFGFVKTDGKFDALLGFYIFKLQRGTLLAGFKNDVIDGCVSKAPAAGYGAMTQFTIVGLNSSANNFNKAAYNNFMATFPATG